jgi:hypothetical protein
VDRVMDSIKCFARQAKARRRARAKKVEDALYDVERKIEVELILLNGFGGFSYRSERKILHFDAIEIGDMFRVLIVQEM